MTMVDPRRLLRAIAASLLLSCGGQPTTRPVSPSPVDPAPAISPQPSPASDRPHNGKLGVSLTVSPADAEVVIDGVSRGKASDLEPVVELTPGLHTLVIAHAGYAPYRVEFSVSDKAESFVVRLTPIK